SKIRRWASRKKSCESMTSAARLNASLCSRIAPSTERSASRLCGSVRSAVALLDMKDGKRQSVAEEVRKKKEEGRNLPPSSFFLLPSSFFLPRPLALGYDADLDRRGDVAMQLHRHVHVA